MSLLFSHRKGTASLVIRLDALRDARGALETQGIDPERVRIKVCNEAVYRRVHVDERMPSVIIADQTPAALRAEFERVRLIHSIIPQASVGAIGRIEWERGFAGYLMHELPGRSLLLNFTMTSLEKRREGAGEEYVRRFKELRRNVERLNSHGVGHGDLHESNNIEGKLIDPQVYFRSGMARRPEWFLIRRDRDWMHKMAERISIRTGIDFEEVWRL